MMSSRMDPSGAGVRNFLGRSLIGGCLSVDLGSLLRAPVAAPAYERVVLGKLGLMNPEPDPDDPSSWLG